MCTYVSHPLSVYHVYVQVTPHVDDGRLEDARGLRVL